MNARSLIASLTQFPWRPALRTLRERLREDRLALSAGSLTFTTTIALVPFFTVVLALFTAFPVFGKLQGALQAWLVQSLVPDAISRQVLGALTQFATKASRLGTVGMGVLVVTALSLVLTIDRTLNGIWRVRKPLRKIIHTLGVCFDFFKACIQMTQCRSERSLCFDPLPLRGKRHAQALSGPSPRRALEALQPLLGISLGLCRASGQQLPTLHRWSQRWGRRGDLSLLARDLEWGLGQRATRPDADANLGKQGQQDGKDHGSSAAERHSIVRSSRAISPSRLRR